MHNNQQESNTVLKAVIGYIGHLKKTIKATSTTKQITNISL